MFESAVNPITVCQEYASLDGFISMRTGDHPVYIYNIYMDDIDEQGFRKILGIKSDPIREGLEIKMKIKSDPIREGLEIKMEIKSDPIRLFTF